MRKVFIPWIVVDADNVVALAECDSLESAQAAAIVDGRELAEIETEWRDDVTGRDQVKAIAQAQYFAESNARWDTLPFSLIATRETFNMPTTFERMQAIKADDAYIATQWAIHNIENNDISPDTACIRAAALFAVNYAALRDMVRKYQTETRDND